MIEKGEAESELVGEVVLFFLLGCLQYLAESSPDQPGLTSELAMPLGWTRDFMWSLPI